MSQSYPPNFSTMEKITISCPNTLKYSDDASTVTIDLRALASLIPPEKGDIFYFPITIRRNILPEPKSEEESESDDEPEIPAKFKKLDKILSNLSFDLECAVSKAYKASAIVRNLIEQESPSSSDSDYASSDESERFLPPPPPLTRQKAIAISSDEEESVTVKDDLPLAPGRYKKQF